MGRLRLTVAVVLVVLAVPGQARAALTTVRAYDLSADSARSLSSVAPQGGFDLVGVHWRGPGSVDVRVSTGGGPFGPWLPVDADAAPDLRKSDAAQGSGWRLGDPLWVGHATRLEVRRRGKVTGVRAFAVRSRVSRVPLRAAAAAGAPPIVSRAAWQADEKLRKGNPEIAPELRLAVVHHTAGSNTYTREQAPAVVRGIMAYHVQANGWNDIGYNALVDRFGTVYEGRYGGIAENVVGAHAKGFNTGSFGIAVLGDFTSVDPSRPAVDALVKTLAWRLDLGHVDPLSTLDAVSAGNERFQPGVPVFLRAISGHRDTGLTACPGSRLYAQLPAIARSVAARGLPKLYAPVLTGPWGGPMTLSARLSAALAWTVTVERSDDGTVVTSVTGRGTAVAASWDTAGLPPGSYVWRIEAPGVTAAQGALTTATTGGAVSISSASVDPVVISPDGDGTLDTATVAYTLTAPANVSAVALDELGIELATVEAPRWRKAGEHEIVFDGLGLPDGAYEIRLLARAKGGQEATRSVNVAVTRTLGRVSLRSAVLTPDGDGRNDRLGVRFALAAPATVRVSVLRGGKWVATIFAGPLGPGAQLVEWDGSRRAGRLREGDYTAVIDATDTIATARVALPFLADWTPPTVTVESIQPARLRVDEPAVLRIVVNGQRRRLELPEARSVRLGGITRIKTLAVVAWDRAGNVTRLALP